MAFKNKWRHLGLKKTSPNYLLDCHYVSLLIHCVLRHGNMLHCSITYIRQYYWFTLKSHWKNVCRISWDSVHCQLVSLHVTLLFTQNSLTKKFSATPDWTDSYLHYYYFSSYKWFTYKVNLWMKKRLQTLE